MKRFFLLVICLGLLLPISASASIKYIESDENETTSEEKQQDTIESINQAEGLSAEQIIMQIKEEGFVTSHGDHYHYYNGNVPFDGIFSEKLLTPEDYQLNKDDIVSEIENGYIVKVDGKYYVYINDSENVTNLRTEEEMVLQGYTVHPNDAKNIVDLKKKFSLPDSSKIRYQLELTEAEYNQNKDDSIIVYLFNQGYVTLINHDLVVFPKEVPYDSNFEKSLIIDDQYELKQEDIISDTKEGHIIKIDKKYALYLIDKENAKNITSIE